MIPVLDLGNVVIQVDWKPFLSYLQRESGIEDDEKIMRFLKSSLFFEFEFGNISPSEFLRRMRVMYGSNFGEDSFFAAFCDIFPAWVPGMETALGRLHELDSGVYCLSNTNEIHWSFIQKKFSGVSNFRRVFASHEIRRRKPYPGTYRQVARELEVSPKEIIFFDDVDANVHGAKRAGLEAHIFKELTDLTAHFDLAGKGGVA